jgi:large subunit ribosomal protein L13
LSAPIKPGKPPKDVTSVKTMFPKETHNDWVVIDAAGQTVGRLATRIATVLRGKHKPDYTPHLAGGDFVIVINAEKVVFTGRKLDQKVYTRYSGYQGGLKTTTARVMLDRHPDRVIRHAVWGMLPKTRQGRRLIRRLKVYAGEAHPHQAQQPKELEVA